MSVDVHSQNDYMATGPRQNIRLVTTECQNLFTEEVINHISISTCIRRAERRFSLWASFLGVYADEQQCLDIRLQNSPEMRNLTLLMLQVLKRNLEHVIAEPYEIRNDDKKGPVYGIDGALDRLYRLATIIQSQQTINEPRGAHKLDSKPVSDEFGETVMRFMQKHFPEAPLSLQQQLSRSVLRRARRLLYSRQQSRVSANGSLSSQISLLNLEAKISSVDPLRTEVGESSVHLNKKVTKLRNSTEQGVPSIYSNTSQGLNFYPDPPSLDAGVQEQLCELCLAPLDKATIGSREAWVKHFDHDLRPYVCVSEECKQTELVFHTPTDWRSHMEAVHSMEWPRYVHQARWTCPYCQQVSGERTFTSAEELSHHLTEGITPLHCLSVGSFELKKLTVECKRYEPISKGHCPLCKSYGKVNGPSMGLQGRDEVEDFYDHFIEHLRYVAVMGIHLWDTQIVAKMSRGVSTNDAGHHPTPFSDNGNKSKEVKPLIHIDSPSPCLPDDSLIDQFRDEMDRVSIRGVNGKDQAAHYVPLSALEKYWTDERVIEILNTRAIQIPQGARFINQGYLRIFSTLVYSGFCDKISWFFHRKTSEVDDYDLPFDSSTFEQNSEWSSSFLYHQWMFCPAEITDGYCHQQALDLRVILPVTYGEYVKAHHAGPDGATLRKVGFNFGFDSYLSMGEHVIFKVYEGDKGEVHYNAETDAYIRLQKLSNDSIAKYFASFHFPEVKKFVIVLEYAEGGSLRKYCETNPPPSTPEDLLLLWKAMFSLTEALDVINMIYQQNPRSSTFVGVHHEINPGNILVFPRGKGTSLFDVQFKLKGFGMAASGAMSASDKRLRLGNRRNGFYVSPETFNFVIHSNTVAAISRLSDIWSLGALFSDFLVWTMTGTDGQDEYRLERREEILQMQQFSNPGYDSCFHDGKKRLKAIDDVHNEALECRRNGDFVSPTISDIILDYMLVEPRDRVDALQIKRYAARKLNEYQESLDGTFSLLNSPDIEPLHISGHILTPISTRMQPLQKHAILPSTTEPKPNYVGDGSPLRQLYPMKTWSPISESSASPQLLAQHESLTESLPPQLLSTLINHNAPLAERDPTRSIVTVDQVYQLLEQKDRLLLFSLPLGVKADKGAEIMDLPGMQEACSKISEEQGRHLIMLVDNFSSMEKHKPKAIKTGRVISYVAKLVDDKYMEVFAASETTKKPTICTSSGKVEKVIKKMKTITGFCNIYKSLNDILNRVLVPGQFKPTIIYIYTDGVWEPGDDKVKLLISQAIDFLDRHGLKSSALMLQFIRFGNDPTGTDRLDYLDNQCKRQTKTDDYDIVNATHCDEHVPNIVIGSVWSWRDEVI